MNQHYAFRITEQGATIFSPTEGSFTIKASHPRWEEIVDCIVQGAYAEAIEIADTGRLVEQHLNAVVDRDQVTGVATILGRQLSSGVLELLQKMLAAGAPADPLRRFLVKLASNPSRMVWERCLAFMEANNFQIFENGDILGYKGVREDYLDSYSRTFDNTPGRTIQVARHDVDDDPDQTCSHGLHIAAFEYANNWAARTLVVQVNPMNVVAIPRDYNNQKMRCCAYTVVADLGRRDEAQQLTSNLNVFKLATEPNTTPKPWW